MQPSTLLLQSQSGEALMANPREQGAALAADSGWWNLWEEWARVISKPLGGRRHVCACPDEPENSETSPRQEQPMRVLCPVYKEP